LKEKDWEQPLAGEVLLEEALTGEVLPEEALTGQVLPEEALTGEVMPEEAFVGPKSYLAFSHTLGVSPIDAGIS
jgi:hypothetical protein